MSEKSKILLVEDDANLGFVIKDNLENANYIVELAEDGEAALKVFHSKSFDMCIFDIMLPKKDGFSLAEDVRKINKEIPIIFLTAKTMKEDKIKGFHLGADDYITKPFSIEELILRVEVILKRSKKQSLSQTSSEEILQLAGFTFDIRNLVLIFKDKSQNLTLKEAELLRLLVVNKNKVLGRETILNLIWGDDDYFTGRSLDVFISRLRKYLKLEPSIEIVNIHGVGFKLVSRENES